MRPYPEEEVIEHIKHVRDTPSNREALRKIFGEPLMEFPQYNYIEVNTLKNSWRTTFSYAWLYRNPPILIDIETML